MNKVTRISQHTGVSTFASRTSPSTDQSLQKSFHLSHPDKIELKKISFPSENKKYPTAQPDTTKTVKRIIDNGLQGRWTEGQLITAVTVAQPFKKAKPNNMQLHLSPFKRGWLFSTLVKLKFNVALIGLF